MAGIGDGEIGGDLIIGGAGSGGLPGTFTIGDVPPVPGIGAIASVDPQQLEAKGSGS